MRTVSPNGDISISSDLCMDRVCLSDLCMSQDTQEGVNGVGVHGESQTGMSALALVCAERTTAWPLITRNTVLCFVGVFVRHSYCEKNI